MSKTSATLALSKRVKHAVEKQVVDALVAKKAETTPQDNG